MSDLSPGLGSGTGHGLPTNWQVITFFNFINTAIVGGFGKSAGIFFSSWQQEFELSKAKTSLFQTVAISTIYLGSPVCSLLMSRGVSSRLIVAVSAVVAASSLIVAGFVADFGALVFFGAFLSCLGAASVYPTGVLCLSACVPDNRRSFSNAVSTAGRALGAIVSPLGLQYLREEFRWRGTVLIYAGIYLNMIISSFFLRRKDLEEEKEDHRGDMPADDGDCPEDDMLVEGADAAPTLAPVLAKEAALNASTLSLSSGSVSFGCRGDIVGQSGAIYGRRGISKSENDNVTGYCGDINDAQTKGGLNTFRVAFGRSLSEANAGVGYVTLPNADQHCTKTPDSHVRMSEFLNGNTKNSYDGESRDESKSRDQRANGIADIPTLLVSKVNDDDKKNDAVKERLLIPAPPRPGDELEERDSKTRDSTELEKSRRFLWRKTENALRWTKENVDTIVWMTFSSWVFGSCILYQVYLIPYGYQFKGLSEVQAASLMSTLSLCDFVGCISVGFLCNLQPVSPHRTKIFPVLLCSYMTTVALFPFTSSAFSLFVVTGFVGIFNGCSVGLYWTVAYDLLGKEKFMAYSGFYLFFGGFGFLLLPPFAGWLSDVTGVFSTVFYVNFGSFFLRSLLIFITLF